MSKSVQSEKDNEVACYAKCILWRLSLQTTTKTLQELRDIALDMSTKLYIDTIRYR